MDGVDRTLENLLGLNGDIIYFDSGYWAKFEAERVEPHPGMPFGIKYSLTLHAPDNKRIMGYDNAHALKRRLRKKRWWYPFDHMHWFKRDPQPYEYTDAAALVEAFWRDVERVLRKRGVSL